METKHILSFEKYSYIYNMLIYTDMTSWYFMHLQKTKCTSFIDTVYLQLAVWYKTKCGSQNFGYQIW